MSKVKYNRELLDSCIERDGATLIGEYKKLNNGVNINFICSCGKGGNKIFKFINNKGGAYCKECVNKNNGLTVYDKNSLFFCMERDKAELLEKYCELTCETQVNFKCKCGNTNKKSFKIIYNKSGAFCEKCSDVNGTEKRTNTIIEKFGVFHISQSQEVKDKKKETNLKNYGVDNPMKSQEIKDKLKIIMKSKEVRDKIKETTNKRYGVDHHMKAQELKDKIKETKNLKENKKYNMTLLNTYIEKDDATLIGEYNDIGLRSVIEYICGNCKKEVCNKTFESIVRYKGLFCKGCTKNKTCIKKGTFSYDKDLLLFCIKRDNAVLKDYENIAVEEVIKYNCKCGKEGNKTFRRINTEGAYCKDCSTSIKIENGKRTNLERYGVTCSLASKESKNKSKATNLLKRGVEYALQSKDVRDKIKETFLKKYGFENAMQNPEVADRNLKACLTPKEYILPNGNKIKVQGYENHALDIIFNEWKLISDDIIVDRTKVPEIWWLDDNNKKRRYFTDIYIPTKNLIIEVKSTWTYNLEKRITQQKLLASKEFGYNTLLWVFNYKHKIVEEYKNCSFELV